MFRYLNPDDIDEFIRQYPSAFDWLKDRANRNEIAALRAEIAGTVTPERMTEINRRLAAIEWRELVATDKTDNIAS